MTLTQATSILLLDPIEEASELQAIGRSYRIGQTKPIHIYRLRVKNEEDEREAQDEPVAKKEPDKNAEDAMDLDD